MILSISAKRSRYGKLALFLRFTVILYHGLFVPKTNSIFAPQLNERTSLLNKFLGRSEATYYASKEMTMERNDRITHSSHFELLVKP